MTGRRAAVWLALILGAAALAHAGLTWEPRSSSPRPAGPRFRPTTPGITDIVNAQALADATQPDAALLLLGDSITEKFTLGQSLAPVVVNYGVSGQTTEGLYHALPRYGAVRRARLVILMIGTNDVAQGLGEGIEARLRGISARIPVPVVWHQVLPTSRGDVSAINEIIGRICQERPDCTLVQTELEASDFNDGTHLTARGYTKWANSLRLAIKEATREKPRRR